MKVKIKNIKVLKENMVTLGNTMGMGDVTPAGTETLGSGDKMVNGLGKPATQPADPKNNKKKKGKSEESNTPDVEEKKNVKDKSKDIKAGKIVGKINRKGINS